MRPIGLAVAAMACVVPAEPAMAQQRAAFGIAAGPLDAVPVHFVSVDTTPLHPHTITLAADAQF
jgi:hypothetical protein